MIQCNEEIGVKMDNFHFLDIKPSIDKKHTASIKDAIFKRAREKSNALAEESETQVQDDVMKLARDSFKQTPASPFSRELGLGLTLGRKVNNPTTPAVNGQSAKAENNIAQTPTSNTNPTENNNINTTFNNTVSNNDSVKETASAEKTEQASETQRVPKRNIESASNSAYVKSVNKELMNDARNQFRQGTNLNTVLNFLNTQAAIKMAKYAHSKINYA